MSTEPHEGTMYRIVEEFWTSLVLDRRKILRLEWCWCSDSNQKILVLVGWLNWGTKVLSSQHIIF